MIELVKYAKELVKHNKVKKIGGPGTTGQLYDVEGHTVRIFSKQGRILFTCDCYNASYFGHNQFCVHKTAIILFESYSNLNERLNKLVDEYKNYKDLKLPVSVDCFINDLAKIDAYK